MRHTRSHTKNRRSHHALKEPTVSLCSHCGAQHRPHHMCLECGYYNGRQIMDLAGDKVKRDARIKEKLERIQTEVGAQATDVPAPALEEENGKDKTTDAKKIVKAKKEKEPKKEEEGGTE